jgi:spore coat protein U-like protein
MRRAKNKKQTTLAVIGVVLSMSNTAMAATESGTMTVSATLSEACSVSSATMTFPSMSQFSDTDIVADSAGTLLINCTASTTPKLWSDSPRILTGPGKAEIPFSLSQAAATVLADDLPRGATASQAIAGFTANGTEQPVELHGLIKGAAYQGMPAGVYAASIMINVNY